MTKCLYLLENENDNSHESKTNIQNSLEKTSTEEWEKNGNFC